MRLGVHVDASPSSPCNAALRRRHAESSALAAEVVLAALSHQSSLAVLSGSLRGLPLTLQLHRLTVSKSSDSCIAVKKKKHKQTNQKKNAQKKKNRCKGGRKQMWHRSFEGKQQHLRSTKYLSSYFLACPVTTPST